MSTRLDAIVAVTRAKKPTPTKRYRVSRIDESFCFVEATNEKEAVKLSNDIDAGWHTWIGDTEATLVDDNE